MFYISKLLCVFSILSMVSVFSILSAAREGHMDQRHQNFRAGDQMHRNVGGQSYYHPGDARAYQRGVNQGAFEGAAGSGVILTM